MRGRLERELIERATPSHRERGRITLFAFFQGWAAAQVISCAYFGLREAPHTEGDDVFTWYQTWLLFGLASLLFGALGWVFSLGLVSMFARANGVVCRTRVAPFFGAAIGIAAWFIEQAWLVRSTPFDLSSIAFACAACIGAVGWSANAWMLRRAAGA